MLTNDPVLGNRSITPFISYGLAVLIVGVAAAHRLGIWAGLRSCAELHPVLSSHDAFSALWRGRPGIARYRTRSSFCRFDVTSPQRLAENRAP